MLLLSSSSSLQFTKTQVHYQTGSVCLQIGNRSFSPLSHLTRSSLAVSEAIKIVHYLHKLDLHIKCKQDQPQEHVSRRVCSVSLVVAKMINLLYAFTICQSSSPFPAHTLRIILVAFFTSTRRASIQGYRYDIRALNPN